MFNIYLYNHDRIGRKKIKKKSFLFWSQASFIKSTFYTHKIVGFEIDPEAIYTPLTFLTYITVFFCMNI